MHIQYSENLTENQLKLIEEISLNCGILKDTARLLLYRGIDSIESAKNYLNPTKSNFNNPFLLKDMQSAVQRIKIARQENQNVLVFGDYDADGICATTILTKALKEYGANVYSIIPEREDGYGLNLDLIKDFVSRTPIDLIITVDCGISDLETIEEIKLLNIDVIVTDHHEPPENLPNTLIINPKVKGQEYPFSGICGAGVAYKLAYALLGERANQYLDLVALATVADSMDLVGENRDIVFEGLKIFNSNLRPCFKHFVPTNTKKITAQSLAFNIAPKINAGGRMGDVKCALKLFNSIDENEIFDLSTKLTEYNLLRQSECETIYKEAKAQISTKGLAYDNVIMVAGDNWKAGFVGIVASRLVEEYARPVIVFAGQEGSYKGSARSIDGINIFDAINYCKDLLVAFGGHSQAAGITVLKENYNLLKQKLNSFVKENFNEQLLEERILVEWDIKEDFSLKFAKEIELLEPFGTGNKRPMFSTKIDFADANQLKKDSMHLSLKAIGLDMLYFGGIEELKLLNTQTEKTIVFETNISVFNNKESIKGFVKKVIVDAKSIDNSLAYILMNECKKCLNNSNLGQEIQIDDKEARLREGYGTIYVAYSYQDVMEFGGLKDLPITLFNLQRKDLKDAVIISPDQILDGYKKIVYINSPIGKPKTNKTAFIVNSARPSIIKDISTDREDFKRIFAILVNACGTKFVNSAQFFTCYGEDVLQGVFATEVFLELGIFNHSNGILRQDLSVKRQLTDSVIYNKLCLLKGELWVIF